MVTLPEGLEKRVQNCSFAAEDGIMDAASVADELNACIQRLKCVTLYKIHITFTFRL
jgi:hypothetical protein